MRHFLFLLFCISAIANSSAPKKWHTNLSPLLLKDLKSYAEHNGSQKKFGMAIYSRRDQKLDLVWNDTGSGIAYHRKVLLTSEGDTMVATIWFKAPAQPLTQNDFLSMKKLSDSLFAHMNAWYQKEQPS